MSEQDDSFERALADIELLQAAYPDEIDVPSSINNNNNKSFPLHVTLSLEHQHHDGASVSSTIGLEFQEGYPTKTGISISSYRSSQKARIDQVARRVRQAAQESLEDEMEGALACCAAAMEAWSDYEQEEEQENAAAAAAGVDYDQTVSVPIVASSNDEPSSKVYKWISGEPLMDRKSTFVAHVCQVSSEVEVKEALDQLISSSSKIQRATHNMYAWRLTEKRPDGTLVQKHDNDDDGESAAGSKMALLLHMRKDNNILVVVSRWYGGIHLGPKRFAHITNVARDLLVQVVSTK